MTFQQVKDVTGYTSSSGVRMFSRLSFQKELNISRKVCYKWEKANKIPKSYEQRVTVFMIKFRKINGN